MFLIILKTFETTSIFHPKGVLNFGDLCVKKTLVICGTHVMTKLLVTYMGIYLL
jgi:hypothetical protein